MPKKYMGQLKVKFLTMFDYEINKNCYLGKNMAVQS